MKRTIMVFDTDSERAEKTLSKLGGCAHADGWRTTYTSDFRQLMDVLGKEPIDVLIIESRLEGCGLDGVGIAHEAMKRNPFVPVVLTGVGDDILARASLQKCVCLLPAAWDLANMDLAIKEASKISEQHKERPLIVRTRYFERAIVPRSISYVESDRRKLRIHVGHEAIEVYGKMSEATSQLPDRFVHCHKSFLVNLSYVMQTEKNCLVLNSGEKIPVSQARRKEVRESFLRFQSRNEGDPWEVGEAYDSHPSNEPRLL